MKSNIITVEFNRKELKENCKINCPVYKGCKRTDRELVKCLLVISLNYNIKDIKKTRCRYGYTKEQLIKKVAQIRFKQETQYGSKDMLKAIYNMCYRQAKEIVEFLGVSE